MYFASPMVTYIFLSPGRLRLLKVDNNTPLVFSAPFLNVPGSLPKGR